MSQRLHFVNYKQVPSVDRLVRSGPLLLEYHDNCFATPFCHLPDFRFSGCLYTSDGHIISISQRPSAIALFQPSDSTQLSPIPGKLASLTGKTIYLGHLFEMFGHFVLESISRMCPIKKFGISFDNYCFHSLSYN